MVPYRTTLFHAAACAAAAASHFRGASAWALVQPHAPARTLQPRTPLLLRRAAAKPDGSEQRPAAVAAAAATWLSKFPISKAPLAPLAPLALGCAVAMAQGALLFAPTEAALAFGSDARKVGEIPASGFVFKDTLDVTAFSDPKVSGVHLYISDFSKPITDRLKGDFFSDPSTASITCVRDGPVQLAPDVDRGIQGEEVFSEAKSLVFKSVKVRRVVDSVNNNVVYVSYSQKVMSNDDSNKSRFKSSLCAVHVDDAAAVPPPPAAAAAAAAGPK